MRVCLLFLLLFSSLFSYDKVKATKSLASLGRAEVYVATLVQRNELEDATSFLKEVHKKYKDSFELLYWQGELHLEKGELDLAESYFRQALVLKKNHELTRKKIEYIQEQKEAKENDNIEDLMGLVKDKGLDFLMIFLAFLGGEIIAKRYSICKNSSIYLIAARYIHRDSLSSSFINRFFFTLKHIIPKKFSLQCLLINFLALTTMTIAMLIPLLFIEFHWAITLILNQPILTMDADAIELHVESLFGVLFLITLVSVYLFRMLSLAKKAHIYEIEFVEELDVLLDKGAYTDLYKVFVDVCSTQESSTMKKLINRYSGDPQRLCNYFENDTSCHAV